MRLSFPNLTHNCLRIALFTLSLLLISLNVTIAQDAETAPDSAIATEQVVDSANMAPLPAANVVAADLPNDKGGAVLVSWGLSPDDDGNGKVSGYLVLRSESRDGPFETAGKAVRGATKFTDNKTDDDKTYYYRVDAFSEFLDATGEKVRMTSASALSSSVQSKAQWFNMNRLYVLLFLLFVAGAIIFYIEKAKKGEEIYIRKIAGIDAVDEAVGRATEMGKKIFYIPGIQDMNDVQTIASIAILGRVAQMAAEYDTWLEVPVSKSMVLVTAREAMKEAYTKVGRPDALQDSQVHYLTDDQFGYAAAIDGMIVREKPATLFYMGAFFAESLILAETGNSVGAIQIAGTAMPAQLPFFVAACDYTLIGEELFAASAYLSREPRQLGSLKGQDMGKGLFILCIIVGVILATLNIWDMSVIFASQ